MCIGLSLCICIAFALMTVCLCQSFVSILVCAGISPLVSVSVYLSVFVFVSVIVRLMSVFSPGHV